MNVHLQSLLIAGALAVAGGASASPEARPAIASADAPTPGSDTAPRDLAGCQQRLAAERAAREDDQAIVADCAALKQAYDALVKQHATLESLQAAKASEEKQSVELGATSERQLARGLERVQGDLDRCIEDSATPWYGRWELWVGAAAGVVAGFAIGFAAGAL